MALRVVQNGLITLKGCRVPEADRSLERTPFVGGETSFSAVAQMVGFGLRELKMLYLSMGID